MTVGELIEKLQKLPLNTKVLIISNWDDYTEPKEPELVKLCTTKYEDYELCELEDDTLDRFDMENHLECHKEDNRTVVQAVVF